jgi:hypothetical protein
MRAAQHHHIQRLAVGVGQFAARLAEIVHRYGHDFLPETCHEKPPRAWALQV